MFRLARFVDSSVDVQSAILKLSHPPLSTVARIDPDFFKKIEKTAQIFRRRIKKAQNLEEERLMKVTRHVTLQNRLPKCDRMQQIFLCVIA